MYININVYNDINEAHTVCFTNLCPISGAYYTSTSLTSLMDPVLLQRAAELGNAEAVRFSGVTLKQETLGHGGFKGITCMNLYESV